MGQKRHNKNSYSALISNIKPGRTIVILEDDYGMLMRSIDVLRYRKQITGEYRLKKSHTIIDNELFIGVAVTKIKE